MQALSIFLNLCCVLVGYGIGRYNIYGNFVKLNSFVNSFKNNQLSSILTSLDLLKQSMFKGAKDISCKIEQDDKKNYNIFYKIDDQYYHVKLVKKRGPQLIVDAIYNSKNEDVTTEIKPLCGMNNDFHMQVYTPKILGYKYLRFDIMDAIGESHTLLFNENDRLSFQ